MGRAGGWVSVERVGHLYMLQGKKQVQVSEVSEGDIGSIFSDKNAKWKNANSTIFVKHALNLLKIHKCILLHTDINIICEEPKISPFRNKIKKNIAKILNISEKSVSIKATTTENLGFTGRKEGIMVQCITTISKPML